MINVGTTFKCRNNEEIQYMVIALPPGKIMSSPWDGENAFVPLELTIEEFNTGIESGLYYLTTKS